MANITVIASNRKITRLNPIYSHDDIENVLKNLREQLHDLLDKTIAQDDYNKRHNTTDIVTDFNEDMFYIAIGIRNYGNDYASIANDTGIPECDIRALESGLVKPNKKHWKILSDVFKFPETFFTRDGNADRNHEFTWRGEPNAYWDALEA